MRTVKRTVNFGIVEVPTISVFAMAILSIVFGLTSTDVSLTKLFSVAASASNNVSQSAQPASQTVTIALPPNAVHVDGSRFMVDGQSVNLMIYFQPTGD